MRIQPFLKVLVLGVAIALFAVSQVRADDVYGRIRGTVTDPSGALIPGVPVTATNIATGVARTVATTSDGSYELVNLPAPATYTVAAGRAGFRRFEATGVRLALNQIYVLNIQLELGRPTQVVMVEAASVQVETTSIQMGARLTGSQVVDLPLNGRDWIALQQTLPGVVAAPAGSFADSYSTSGARSQDNGFLLNGTDNNDFALNVPNAIPSPDAIAEVSMITNTINPEYGRSSGAVLNAVTKSGSNSFHGDAFEFYRDPFLNARNFFQAQPDQFHQNQFGGTIGGPIRKGHTFFFYSYQGTRNREPIEPGRGYAGGTTPVLTAAQRNGAFPDLATSTGTSAFPLVGDDGTTYPAGTAYSTIFSQGTIPQADMNSIATSLVSKYMPLPNFGSNEYSFIPLAVNDHNQHIVRIDQNFGAKDSIYGYWFYEQDNTVEDESFYAGSLPGFGDTDGTRVQGMNLTWNHTFGSSMVNEARVGYNRLGWLDNLRPRTVVSPSSLGFTGIIPQDLSAESVPCVAVVGLYPPYGTCTFGSTVYGPQPRIDQTYQVSDNISWVKGRHTLKMGFDMRRAQVENTYDAYNSGAYFFYGAGTYTTGDPEADFLLGTPDQYVQTSGGFINARAREYYAYFQDQFKIRPNLTLTYGTGWQVNTPIADLWNDNTAINAYRPGQQSTVYPTAPPGLLYPGDDGLSSATTPERYKHFGPRLGFAWSPGSSTKWSVRSGFGVYFNQVEEELTLQNLFAPPVALEDYGIGDMGGSPSFGVPYTDIKTGASIPNRYPYTAPPKGSTTFNFGLAEPFSLNVMAPTFTTPSAYNYNLTIQRELPGSTIITVAYVGHQGRHLETIYELNPAGSESGNPACAALYPVCNPYDLGFVVPNTFRNPLVGPNGGVIFGSVGQQATDANSNYNGLQFQATRHTAHGLEFQVSYTWSHSLDNISSFENLASRAQPNPFDHELDYGDSAYDARQRLVFTYSYEIPSVRRFQSFHAIPSRLTDGWRIAGLTTFQSGFPVDTYDSSDSSLTCYAEVSFYGCADRPNVVSPVVKMNPRTNAALDYFSPSSFAMEALGTMGNAGRNTFHGPGYNNWTIGLYKDTKITESTEIELRFESFNTFNHTQFQNPASDINSPTFGQVSASQAPRILQLAAKFIF
jgi:hypothetical protein